MEHIDPNLIIGALGGTVATARIFGIEPQAVTQWRTRGIPPARLMYLRLLRPDLFQAEPETNPQQAA